MKTRDDLFRIRTEPSDTVQRLGKVVLRIFQSRGTKRHG